MDGPTLVVMIALDSGRIDTITVLAKTAADRHQGFSLIQELRYELETFEARVKARLAALERVQ